MGVENGNFDLDVELKGVVEVESTSSSMLGTKVEIKMKKAEPGSWAKLDIPREKMAVVEKKKEEPKVEVVDDDFDDLDLDDLDLTPMKAQLSKEASNGRTNHEII